MKNNVLKAGLFSMILLGMVSCVNKEKELADKRINELESYVDSLKAVSAEERQANWDQITADYEAKNARANDALLNLEETERWLQYRDSRNQTAHEYGIGFAENIVEILAQFIKDAKNIVTLIDNHNNAN